MAAVLTADGHVLMLEPGGTLAGSVAVIDPFDTAVDWAVLPTLSTAGDAGPRHRRAHRRGGRAGSGVLEVAERFAVGGRPSGVAVLGQPG